MCGEHCRGDNPKALRIGSPPHVRGTLPADIVSTHIHGITPACAGNTEWRLSTGSAETDHPRMCGEHLKIALFQMSGPGSPPHVRGTL